jgi:hypothetical protein
MPWPALPPLPAAPPMAWLLLRVLVVMVTVEPPSL